MKTSRIIIRIPLQFALAVLLALSSSRPLLASSSHQQGMPLSAPLTNLTLKIHHHHLLTDAV
eukprot:54650-Rhodomonas_salina.4